MMMFLAMVILIQILSAKMEVISPAISSPSITPTSSYPSTISPIVVPTPLPTTETPTTISPSTVANIRCDSNPCFNGAICSIIGANDYICSCLPGWDGINCGIRTTSYEVSTTFDYIIVVGVRYSSYSPLLEDKSSTLYKEACNGLNSVVTESLNVTTASDDPIINVHCLGFSFGSIIANYIVEVKTSSKRTQSTIAEAIEQNFAANSFVLNSTRSTWAIRSTSTIVTDYDECSQRVSGYCDASATCSNADPSFICECSSDLVLSESGICTEKIAETVDNLTLYIIFGILGFLLLSLIILMAIVLRRRKDRRQSYKPSKPSLFYGDTESRFGRESVTTPHFSDMPQERLRARMRTADDMEWDPYAAHHQQHQY